MTAFDPTTPFVLLDDARRGGSMLFTSARDIVTATATDEVAPAIARLRQAARDGLWVAGFMAFEAGYALEPRLRERARLPLGSEPLLWFGLFEHRARLDAGELEAMLPSSRAEILSFQPRIGQSEHEAAIRATQELIAAGDIYQANITFPADVRFAGHPAALYRLLRGAQSAPYGALVHTGSAWILSFSPELFFEIGAGRITTRPMKGTAARLPEAAADRRMADGLSVDPKNRAENLMIVDLLRNDLSRVAEPGSVQVSDLFRVDTYPTIHQMTSTVSARLQPDRDAVDVLGSLFPCGSVTGAPKIRAMEVIAELEPTPRGLYTGSIGYIGPDGSARFNVAIRTLVANDDGQATLGLGSGIVADSIPADEWAECLAKAGFLNRRARRFDLIETFRFDPTAGLVRLDRHLDRLTASARHWGFDFDRRAALEGIAGTVAGLTAPARIRLLLSPDGSIAVQAGPLPPLSQEPVEVALATLGVAPDDPRLFHKTTDRGFYDEPRRASGAFEILFVNRRGELTEGSFTNIFVPRDGRLLTPPLAAGLLPGILRAELLETGAAIEAPLVPDDLTGEFLIGNSLRGLMRATLLRPTT